MVQETVQTQVGKLVDMLDETSAKSLLAIVAVEDVALQSGQAVLNVGDTTFDALAKEAEELRVKLVDAVRKLVDAVVSPLP